MRFLTYLLGVEPKIKEDLDAYITMISPIVNGNARYIYVGGTLILHYESDLPQDEIKEYIAQSVEDTGVYFFIQPFPDKLSVNLSPEDCKWFFDLNSQIQFDNTEAHEYYFGGSKMSTDFEIEDDDDDDDEDDNLVLDLINKYKIKKEEPTIDEILEKIYSEGMESLSIQEIAILNEYK